MSPDGMPRNDAALALAMAVAAGFGLAAEVVGVIVPGLVPWQAILAPWLLVLALTAYASLRAS